MRCAFVPSGFDPSRRKYVYHCPNCNQPDLRISREGATIRRMCKATVPIPDHGPGTELKAMLGSLGFTSAGCGGCEGMMLSMNQWGADGCRERRATIISHLEHSAERLGWLAKLAAGATAGWLVDTAIARAAANPLSTTPLQCKRP